MTRPLGCGRKVKYATRALAEERIATATTMAGHHPYECWACGCWHTSRMTEAEAARDHARHNAKVAHNAELVQRLLKERGLR